MLEGEKADTPSKRRKVSEKVFQTTHYSPYISPLLQMLEMRRQDSMDEEVVEEGGMRRNQLATGDKVSSITKGRTETLAVPKEKVNIVKQSSHSQPMKSSPQSQIKKGSFKTPEFVLDRSLEDEEKKEVERKVEEKAVFDLSEVVEIEENSSEESVEVLKVKTGKKRQLELNNPREHRTPVYRRLYELIFINCCLELVFF